VLNIPTAEVFVPLLQPARYKGAYGGRGSGKSHFFAEMMVDDHYRNPGLRSVCIREVQKSLKDSAKRLIEDKIQALGLGPHFEVQNDQIKSRGGGLILFQGMQDHTAESSSRLRVLTVHGLKRRRRLVLAVSRCCALLFAPKGSEIWASRGIRGARLTRSTNS
jgi:phage terminase large subunit